MGTLITPREKNNHFLYFILVAFLFSVATFFYYKHSFKKGLKRIFDENHQADKHELETSVEITKEIISLNHPGLMQNFSIEIINCIYETKQYFFIKFFTGTAIIIPKSKVANTEELKNLLIEIASVHQKQYVEKY